MSTVHNPKEFLSFGFRGGVAVLYHSMVAARLMEKSHHLLVISQKLYHPREYGSTTDGHKRADEKELVRWDRMNKS